MLSPLQLNAIRVKKIDIEARQIAPLKDDSRDVEAREPRTAYHVSFGIDFDLFSAKEGV